MNRKLPIVVAAGLALLPGVAMAQGYWDGRGDGRYADFRSDFDRYGLERRAAEQRARIDHGIRSGRLTRNEAGDLMRDQDRIWRRIQMAKADRFLSRREVASINDALNDQDRRIFRETHDGTNRYPRRY